MLDPREKLRMLVLEDDRVDRMLLERMLAKSFLPACEIKYATLLQDALQLLRKESFDVVLSDLNMPDSSGIKTLAKIKEAHPDAAIVAVTGQTDKKLGQRVLAEGAQDYLVKGEFDEHALSKSVVQAVQRKQAERDKLNMETQLRQGQKVEATGPEAEGSAHDFNNMLCAMIGYANLALQDIPAGTRARSNLEEMLTVANRARDVVKQMLSSGREGQEDTCPNAPKAQAHA